MSSLVSVASPFSSVFSEVLIPMLGTTSAKAARVASGLGGSIEGNGTVGGAIGVGPSGVPKDPIGGPKAPGGGPSTTVPGLEKRIDLVT